jgi:hypothetical protein
MSGKLLDLKRRLARVERTLVDVAKREEMVNCICSQSTTVDADRPEEFEAEMNLTCPAHGYRRLGALVVISHVGRESAKLDQLLETYKSRLYPKRPRISHLRRVGLELKHDLQES